MGRYGMILSGFCLGLSAPQLFSLAYRSGNVGHFLYWATNAVAFAGLTIANLCPGAFAGMFGTSPTVFKKFALLFSTAGLFGLAWGWF